MYPGVRYCIEPQTDGEFSSNCSKSDSFSTFLLWPLPASSRSAILYPYIALSSWPMWRDQILMSCNKFKLLRNPYWFPGFLFQILSQFNGTCDKIERFLHTLQVEKPAKSESNLNNSHYSVSQWYR